MSIHCARPAVVAATAFTVLLLGSATARAQETYKIGLTGALTGGAAGTYAPMADAVRIYFESLNEKGGINGRKVSLTIRDSAGDPQKVVAELKFFASENALATIFVSPSGTIGAYTAESKKLGMPTLYVNACYPPATPPQPNPEFFCPGISTLTDSYTAVDLMFRLMGNEKIRFGFITSDIPGARIAHQQIMAPYAQQKGAEVIDVAVVPVGTTDLGPIARSLAEKGANAVISYTLSHHMLAGADAFNKLGWKGKFLMTSGLPGVYAQMEQLKAENVYAFDQFSLLTEDKPVHKDIVAAAKKYHFHYPLADVRWGWRNAMVLGEALKACGWPCDREKLIATLGSLTVDSKDMLDLNGGPVKFTATNHTSPEKAYRVYRWDPKAGGFVTVIDWMRVAERDWK